MVFGDCFGLWVLWKNGFWPDTYCEGEGPFLAFGLKSCFFFREIRIYFRILYYVYCRTKPCYEMKIIFMVEINAEDVCIFFLFYPFISEHCVVFRIPRKGVIQNVFERIW